MSVDKRPRNVDARGGSDEKVIVISSDEEGPPRKRNKSDDSPVNGLRDEQNHIKPPTAARNKTPIRESANVESTTLSKKPSPWKNRPSWSRPSISNTNDTDTTRTKSTSSQENAVRNNVEDSRYRDTSRWTTDDTDRLRTLSITPDRPVLARAKKQENSTASNYDSFLSGSSTSKSHVNVNGAGEDVVNLSKGRDSFKLPTATALKFDPSSDRTTTSADPPKHLHQSSSQYRPNVPDRTTGNLTKADQSRLLSSNIPSRTIYGPGNSQVEVKIPARQHSTNLTSALSSEQPRVFQNTGLVRPEAHATPKFSINLPLPEKNKREHERKALQEKLKKNIKYAKAKPKEVEEILGLTGFSEEFSPESNEERFKKAAQTKKRTVDRTKVRLAMNDSSPSQPPSLSTKIAFVHPKDQVKEILTARFAEHSEPPLTFANTVNDRRLNGKFQFVSDYVIRKGVKTTGPVGQPGCRCAGGCYADCTCLRKSFKDKAKRDYFLQIPQYWRRPDGLVVLRDDFIERHMIQVSKEEEEEEGEEEEELEDSQTVLERVEITECSEACGCDSSCVNRVVQKGRTVPLEIFETNRCGFGVRSSTKLVRGQFIELYLGEVITDNELVRREEAAEAGSTSYIYSLDWFSSQQPYHIDGENFGSAMRFVNHSCDPNAGTFPVLNNKSTKQLHHVAFFALKDIPAGTEITIDYTPQATGTVYELNAADEGMEKCYCGAKNCRQMLWLPGKERKARKKVVGRTFD